MVHRVLRALRSPAAVAQAGLTCKAWYPASAALLQAIKLRRYGKQYKRQRDQMGSSKKKAHQRLVVEAKAMRCFERAAAEGCAAAATDAGLLLWEQDLKAEAVAWYQRAAEEGDPTGAFSLGLAMLKGEGAELDKVSAVKWLRVAADAGVGRAQYTLALCLQQGTGAPVDMPGAERWYLSAALLGNVRAMHNLAKCYLERHTSGPGSARARAARMWTRRAAECGHPRAQYDHGLQLEKDGCGHQALVYFQLAVRSNVSLVEAREARNRMSQRLSELSRHRALQEAHKWQPRNPTRYRP
mmetsp:Transcript_5054/g.9604  ORF Transcript_5054/g.9604 Transcript_5054/m.9604 type:complete len:298 (+) Transcript_5054:1895-2788(+)